MTYFRRTSTKGFSSAGRALVSKTRCRRFESCNPCQRYILVGIFVFLLFLNLGLILASDSTRYVNGGKAVGFCESIKDEPVEVELNGDAEVTIQVGETYDELGADGYNGCENAEVTIDGKVDTDTAGDYTIKYIATAEDGRTGEVSRVVHVISPRGVVYLTFDDGPSPYTAELLDVLAEYGVKATFFVTCAGDDDLILREYNEGHTVALHTCSHNYSYIYSSTDAYFEDLYNVQNRVKNITGEAPNLIRFPGGSSNLISARYDGGIGIMSVLVDEVEARGFTYFDWNVSSGDAGGAYTADAVFGNVVYALKDGGSSVVLQHDIKDYSVAAVGDIIRYGLDNGYVFDRLTASSFTAHHGVNN